MQRNDMEQERGNPPFVPFLARAHERSRPQPASLPRPVARARVGLVDSSRLTRECLAGALGAAGNDFAVQGFTTAAECIGAAGAGYDLLLCHAHGEGRAAMPVLADIGALRSACPETPIVVLHDSAEPTDPCFVRRLFGEGARGFIPTSRIGLPLAAAALHFVQAGGQFAPVELLLDDAADRPPAALDDDDFLTPRQRLVFSYLRRGKANKIIAYELGVSESTVKVHIKNIMRKIGATNRTEAVYKAQTALLRA